MRVPMRCARGPAAGRRTGHVQRLGAQAVFGVHVVDEQFLVEVAEALVGLAGQQAAGGDQERGALRGRQAVQRQLPERQSVEMDGRQEAPVTPVEDPWAEQAGLTVARLQVAPLGGEEGAAGTESWSSSSTPCTPRRNSASSPWLKAPAMPCRLPWCSTAMPARAAGHCAADRCAVSCRRRGSAVAETPPPVRQGVPGRRRQD